MIVLASKSASRRAMLEAAGVAFEVQPANVDERSIEDSVKGLGPALVAQELADAKAVALKDEDKPVLGSDSLVVVDGRRFDKPESREEAAAHLRFFSGKVMHLHSAASIAVRNQLHWRCAEEAQLHVRALSETFIQTYLEAEWPEVGYCVGVFRIEARGPQLFTRIEGDHFTVLGMPLLPVLEALRELGELPR